MRYAKAHPGEISYATVGTGSAQEIFARQLERLTGIVMNRVPYRGGAQILQDLLPGRVQFYVAPMISITPLAKEGALAMLGVSSPARLDAAPRVPTLREQGVDFVRYGWLGICAAAGTPQSVISRLNREIAAIVASPDYRAVTERAGSIPVSSTPDELRAIIAQTRTEVEATIREFGLQQEKDRSRGTFAGAKGLGRAGARMRGDAGKDCAGAQSPYQPSPPNRQFTPTRAPRLRP